MKKNISKMVEQYNNLYKEICITFFYQEIMPIIVQHDWTVYWGTRNVMVKYKDEEITDSEALDNIKEKCKIILFNMGYVDDYGLWDILSVFTLSGKYHKSFGIVSN